VERAAAEDEEVPERERGRRGPVARVDEDADGEERAAAVEELPGGRGEAAGQQRADGRARVAAAEVEEESGKRVRSSRTSWGEYAISIT
jgi:hypothetical protein